jgi:Cd2+/Zn2+-exporting ATPase/Cu+-exporting ATPase
VALMRDDWSLVPEAVRIGRTAARTIRQNLAFSAVYNVAVLATAGLGLLPAVWAAALHSLPDGVILLNSGRLLRARRTPRASAPQQPEPGKVALPVVQRHTHAHGNGPCHDHAHCHHHS